ncbi:hypothetical protein NH340_JMT07672 [Sarcoptes scabiei]|nr:hypothetical protein NH340_JMT07672 [Sarcoptes scabiei]
MLREADSFSSFASSPQSKSSRSTRSLVVAFLFNLEILKFSLDRIPIQLIHLNERYGWYSKYRFFFGFEVFRTVVSYHQVDQNDGWRERECERGLLKEFLLLISSQFVHFM